MAATREGDGILLAQPLSLCAGKVLQIRPPRPPERSHSAVKTCWSTCILLLLGLVRPAAPQPADQPPFAQVPPGITYVQERIGDVPWAIYVVKVDRTRAGFRFASTLGGDSTLGLRPVTAQVAAWPADQGAPLAAVNADFYVMTGPYRGDPRGLQIVRGELTSIGERDAFWVDRAGHPHIGPVRSRVRVAWPAGGETPLGLNEARKEDAAVLYTPAMGASTHTAGGRELVLERDGDTPWLPVCASRTITAKVREVREGGDVPLDARTLVLSLGAKLAPTLPAGQSGAVLRLSFESEPDLAGVETAVGGGPILLSHGEIADFGKGPQPRHPRTALGWNDTHYFLVVVDGRQKGLSAGMTFPELADLARRLGCTEAINLDGGGSSTLWLGGKVMNSPSGGRERPVANALVLVSGGR